MKKSEDSYKLNMIWNMIEVKIAAITVRRCAKCLEFLAGKEKQDLKGFQFQTMRSESYRHT